MNPNRSADPSNRFVKLKIESFASRIGGMIALKQLSRSDAFTLLALASFGTYRSHRIRVNVKTIAEQYGSTYSSMANSIAKLKTLDLIALRRDGAGSLYYVIDPDIMEFNGSPQSYAAAKREINEAAAERLVVPVRHEEYVPETPLG